MADKNTDPDKERWEEESRAFREMYERRLREHAEWEAPRHVAAPASGV
jgi:hypothetical protein